MSLPYQWKFEGNRLKPKGAIIDLQWLHNNQSDFWKDGMDMLTTVSIPSLREQLKNQAKEVSDIIDVHGNQINSIVTENKRTTERVLQKTDESQHELGKLITKRFDTISSTVDESMKQQRKITTAMKTQLQNSIKSLNDTVTSNLDSFDKTQTAALEELSNNVKGQLQSAVLRMENKIDSLTIQIANVKREVLGKLSTFQHKILNGLELVESAANANDSIINIKLKKLHGQSKKGFSNLHGHISSIQGEIIEAIDTVQDDIHRELFDISQVALDLEKLTKVYYSRVKKVLKYHDAKQEYLMRHINKTQENILTYTNAYLNQLIVHINNLSNGVIEAVNKSGRTLSDTLKKLHIEVTWGDLPTIVPYALTIDPVPPQDDLGPAPVPTYSHYGGTIRTERGICPVCYNTIHTLHSRVHKEGQYFHKKCYNRVN